MEKLVEVFVSQLTKDGGFKYPYVNQMRTMAKFNKSRGTCYALDKTFKKIKGGGPKGGNYYCLDDNEEYRIST